MICEKPKCQYSEARKKCIKPNPYIEKIAECGRNKIKKETCLKTYNKIKDSEKACDRMKDRLKFENLILKKSPDNSVIKASPIRKKTKELTKVLKDIAPKSKYIDFKKKIKIPKDHAELRKITMEWLKNNREYIIQPLGGKDGNYNITSLNDILVAQWDDNIAVGVDAYVDRMKNTGVFSETPNIYAIAEMYGVIINLFLWINETKRLHKMTFIPWKYHTNTKIKNAFINNNVLSTALINGHYYSVEDKNIKDKYRLENAAQRIIDKALREKYNMHLYDKKSNRDGNCFFHVIIRQLQLLSERKNST